MNLRVGVLMVISLLFLAPFLWMISSSVKPAGEAVRHPFAAASELVTKNYAESLDRMGAFDAESAGRGFARLTFNTVLITVLSIVFQLFTCSLAGYAFARMRFRGKALLFPLVLATMMLPVQVTIIPQFIMFQGLGWIDTYFPLLAPALLGGNPFFIFLFRQYFKTVPKDVIESARIDGCGWWGIYWRIMLPLSRPVLATVAIFTLLWTWNDLWLPLIYINSPEKATLTLALAGFSRTYRIDVELLMAASTIVVLPCVIVYFLAQKYFVRTVQLSASKG